MRSVRSVCALLALPALCLARPGAIVYQNFGGGFEFFTAEAGKEFFPSASAANRILTALPTTPPHAPARLSALFVVEGSATDAFAGTLAALGEGAQRLSLPEANGATRGILAHPRAREVSVQDATEAESAEGLMVIPVRDEGDQASRAALLRVKALGASQVAVVFGDELWEGEAAVAAPRRRLQDENSTTGNATEYTTYTAQEISAFQVNLWTAVGLVLLVLAAVGALANMEVIPDSLLYAKFQADVSGFKSD